MTDPAATDLVTRAKAASAILAKHPSEVYFGVQLYDDLAVAVEALRETNDTDMDQIKHMMGKIEASEARVVALAGALRGVLPYMAGALREAKKRNLLETAVEIVRATDHAVAISDAPPAAALERAKARDEFEGICREFVRRVEAGEIRSARTYAQCVNAIAALDALKPHCTCLPLPEPQNDDCPIHGEDGLDREEFT